MAYGPRNRREERCYRCSRVASGFSLIVLTIGGCADLLDIPSNPRLVDESAVLPGEPEPAGSNAGETNASRTELVVGAGDPDTNESGPGGRVVGEAPPPG